MLLGQSSCVGGFEVPLVCQLCIRLNHAMDIAELHMCKCLSVYFDSGMLGL